MISSWESIKKRGKRHSATNFHIGEQRSRWTRLYKWPSKQYKEV